MTHNNTGIASCIIRADELTEGDIIKHLIKDIWQVISEPEYTYKGIAFDIMWMDIDTHDNTQNVCFAPDYKFELVNHLPPTQSLVKQSYGGNAA